MPRKKNVIVGLGEILWDVFPDRATFGGAPANFACSVAGLADEESTVAVVSAVGQDDLGDQAIAKLQEAKVDTRCVACSPRFPTGRVDVKIDPKGAASYTFADDVAWDHLEWSSSWQELAQETDAVCFGTLAQRSPVSRESIYRFLGATRQESLRVYDVNLRPPHYAAEWIARSLELANVLKLNDEELAVVLELAGIGADAEESATIAALIEKYSLRYVILTKGSEGSSVYASTDEVSHQDVAPTEVVDTVGAGDSFTATFVLGILKGLGLNKAHQWANRISSYVCSQPGATPVFPSELRQVD